MSLLSKDITFFNNKAPVNFPTLWGQKDLNEGKMMNIIEVPIRDKNDTSYVERDIYSLKGSYHLPSIRSSQSPSHYSDPADASGFQSVRDQPTGNMADEK